MSLFFSVERHDEIFCRSLKGCPSVYVFGPYRVSEKGSGTRSCNVRRWSSLNCWRSVGLKSSSGVPFLVCLCCKDTLSLRVPNWREKGSSITRPLTERTTDTSRLGWVTLWTWDPPFPWRSSLLRILYHE